MSSPNYREATAPKALGNWAVASVLVGAVSAFAALGVVISNYYINPDPPAPVAVVPGAMAVPATPSAPAIAAPAANVAVPAAGERSSGEWDNRAQRRRPRSRSAPQGAGASSSCSAAARVCAGQRTGADRFRSSACRARRLRSRSSMFRCRSSRRRRRSRCHRRRRLCHPRRLLRSRQQNRRQLSRVSELSTPGY